MSTASILLIGIVVFFQAPSRIARGVTGIVVLGALSTAFASGGSGLSIASASRDIKADAKVLGDKLNAVILPSSVRRYSSFAELAGH